MTLFFLKLLVIYCEFLLTFTEMITASSSKFLQNFLTVLKCVRFFKHFKRVLCVISNRAWCFTVLS